MDKVSIIVPVYNASNMIEKCIKSIINQTYENLEIICINDGSTDDSLKKLKKLEKQDLRIKIIDKENAGVSSARNNGLEYATGKYVMFVDADDYLLENIVEMFVTRIKESGTDMIIANHLIYDGKNIIKNKNIRTRNKLNKSQFLDFFYYIYKNSIFNQPWNKLYIREKIKSGFIEEISLGEDLLFNITYINNIDNITYIDEFLYVYDVSSQNSITKKQKHTEKSFLELYIHLYNELFCSNKYSSRLKFDVFVLRHYCSFLKEKYENNIKVKMDKYDDLKKCILNINYVSYKDELIKHIIFSKTLFYIMNIIFYFKR